MINPVYHATGRPVEMNRQSWQSHNLIGWWPCLGYRRGDVKDYGPRGNDGVVNGTITSRVSSHFGNVADIQGSTDYFNCGDVGVSGLNYLTIAIWAQTDTLTGGASNIRDLASKNNTQFVIRLFTTTDYHPTEDVINIRLDSANVYSTTQLVIGEWYHICMLFDGDDSGSELKIYINGVEENSAAYAGTIGTSTTDMYIGDNPTFSGRTWDGGIADVRIYDKAFSPAQIAALYNPNTRWDLYKRPRRVFPKAPVAAAGSEGPLVSGRLIRGGSLVRGGVLVR